MHGVISCPILWPYLWFIVWGRTENSVMKKTAETTSAFSRNMSNGHTACLLSYNTNKETVIIEPWFKNSVLSQVERNFSKNKVNGRIKKITVEKVEDSYQARAVALPSTSLSMGKAVKEIAKKRLSPRYSQFMIFTTIILIHSWMNNQFQDKVLLLCGDGK
jgi:hypothetical protein